MITQIANNAYLHTSYLQTEDFGKVPCNGLITKGEDETIIFDTPGDEKTSEELINWIKKQLHCKVNAVIATHFHMDCLGGLAAFHKQNIPSYALQKTIDLAKANNFPIPQNAFNNSIVIKFGKEKVIAKYYGAGHTQDNIVGYYPAEQILFGGCLIKEMNANKGNLEDANEATWSNTVTLVKQAYPDARLVIPGHGNIGNSDLLVYTVNLFKSK